MDPTPFKRLHFSTDEVPASKRFEAYRETYCRTIVRHDVAPIGDQPFRFEATLFGLPNLGLAYSAMSPHRKMHGRQHVDSDDLVLGVGLGGGCVAQQRGMETAIGVGEAILLTCGDPADVAIPTSSRSISIRVPNAVLRPRIAQLDDRVCIRIPQGEALRLLTGYIGTVRNIETLVNAELRDIVVGHIHDLVSLVLGAEGEARQMAEERGARAARRAAILRNIERHSADPNLTPGTVAARLGITPRYVHMLLEETGRSFTYHLLARRLEKAAALLRDPAWRTRKVADIANESGFTDLSHFNRAFRRHFGATPTDIRQSADIRRTLT